MGNNKQGLQRLVIACLLCVFILVGLGTMWRLKGLDRARVQGGRGHSWEDNLAKEFQKLMTRYQVPGAAVALTRGGKIIWSKGFGLADQLKRIPVDSHTIFQVGSISKPVTAWGVLSLVEKGKLGLDTPVETYLTRWNLPPAEFSKDEVTIRRLLNHTAGLSVGGYSGIPPGQPLPSLEESLAGKAPGQEGVRIIAAPGQEYIYSGGGYTLLQLVIEEVTGMPFSQYMAETVLAPLGMVESSFEWKPEMRGRVSKCYGELGGLLPNYLFREQAAAGLYTTVEDLARFTIASYQGGMVLQPETLRLMKTPGLGNYGLGYDIEKLPNELTVISHNGVNRGWRTQFTFISETQDGIVILANSENGDNLVVDITNSWVKYLTGFELGYFPEIRNQRRIMMVIDGIGAALLLGFMLGLIYQLYTKKRRFMPLSVHMPMWKGLIRVIFPLVIIVLWWMVFYTGILSKGWHIASFLPAGFLYASVEVVLWSVYLMMTGLFPKIKVGNPSDS